MFDDGTGDDVVRLGNGRDSGAVSSGRDVVYLGAGDDAVDVIPDGMVDVINCGPGHDLVYLHDQREPADQFLGCEHITVISTD